MRHAALLKRGNGLWVFWTQVGDMPERILLSRIDLAGDWTGWKESEAVEVLRPEFPWEGADAPLVPSVRSTAYGQVNQLRYPRSSKTRAVCTSFTPSLAKAGSHSPKCCSTTDPPPRPSPSRKRKHATPV